MFALRIYLLFALSLYSFSAVSTHRYLTNPERKDLTSLLGSGNKLRLSVFSLCERQRSLDESRLGLVIRLEGLVKEWRAFLQSEADVLTSFEIILREANHIIEKLKADTSHFVWENNNTARLSFVIYQCYSYAAHLLDSGRMRPYAGNHSAVSLLDDPCEANLILHYLAICDFKEMMEALFKLSANPLKFGIVLKFLNSMDSRPLNLGLRSLREVFAYLKLRDPRFQNFNILPYQRKFIDAGRFFTEICSQETISQQTMDDFFLREQQLSNITNMTLNIFSRCLERSPIVKEGLADLFSPNPEYFTVRMLASDLMIKGNAFIHFSLTHTHFHDILKCAELKEQLYGYLRTLIRLLRHPKNNGELTVDHIPIRLIYRLIGICDRPGDFDDRVCSDLCYLGEFALAQSRSCHLQIHSPDLYIHYDRWPVLLSCIASASNLYDMCNQFYHQALEMSKPSTDSKIVYADFSIPYFTTIDGLAHHLKLLDVLQKLIACMAIERAISHAEQFVLLKDVAELKLTLQNAKQGWVEFEQTATEENIAKYTIILRRVTSKVCIALQSQIRKINKNQ